MLTIVLSGPLGKLKQVHKSLEDAGFTLALDKGGQPTLYDWGNAEDTPKGHVFATVEGEDMNRAHSAVVEWEWRLRAYWCNEDAGLALPLVGDQLTPEQRIARVEQDLAILKGVA